MNRLNQICLKALPAVLFTLLACHSPVEGKTEPGADRPNVILIFADDLGPGLLGCYGQKLIRTPNIDRLAAEGMKFNNYYGGVYCAPARWTLLTGMHDGRQGGWSQSRAGLLVQMDKAGTPEPEYTERFARYVEKNSAPISDQEVFLGQVAQGAGYHTGQFGKLDVGFLTDAQRVRRFGWDSHEGYYSHQRCHGFYPPYLWRNGEKFALEGNHDPACGKMSEKGDEPAGSGGNTYSQEVFLEGMLRFLHKNKDRPFFLYHPTQLPHGPVAVPKLHPDFADHPDLSLAEKKYASMVKMLDDHVGRILDELVTLGIDQKTVVFFTSDNGHELYYGPKPDYHARRFPDGTPANLTDKKWRTSEAGDVFDGAAGRAGLKRSGYQGGMQCPLVVRWPGQIAPGSTSDHLSAHYDFMATLAELTGGKIPRGKDSLSYLPTLLGKKQQHQHEHIVINNRFTRMGSSAIVTRDGWKLVQTGKDKNAYQLYRLSDDNQERHNIEADYPERATRLKENLLRELGSARPDLEG